MCVHMNKNSAQIVKIKNYALSQMMSISGQTLIASSTIFDNCYYRAIPLWLNKYNQK